jgi:hypothetical protein
LRIKKPILICSICSVPCFAAIYAYYINTATTLYELNNSLFYYLLGIGIWCLLFFAIDYVFSLRAGLKHINSRTVTSILLVGVLFLIILPSSIGLVLGSEKRLPNTENRNLAMMPGLTAFADFSKNFDSYVNDNFGLRKLFIRMNNTVKVDALQIPQISDVILGKNSWLFYKDAVNDSNGTTQLDDILLQALNENIQKQNDWLTQRGIYYLIVIAPNKESIYPEYIPDIYSKGQKQSRTDQILEYLQSHHSKVPILDLRKPILEAKSAYPYLLYWKTDTHWNEYGAFIGYCSIIEQLSVVFPNLQRISKSDFTISEAPILRPGDLSNMLSMQDKFVDTKSIKATLNSNGDSDSGKIGTAVIFGDSFYDAIDPYFSNNFSEISKPERSHNFDYNWITGNPEVVINLVVERRLHALINNAPG